MSQLHRTWLVYAGGAATTGTFCSRPERSTYQRTRLVRMTCVMRIASSIAAARP